MKKECEVPEDRAEKAIGKENNILKTIIVATVGPLFVATILGYVSLYTTMTRMGVLMEQNEKRLAIVEEVQKDRSREIYSMREMAVKQTELMRNITEQLKAMKEEQRMLSEHVLSNSKELSKQSYRDLRR